MKIKHITLLSLALLILYRQIIPLTLLIKDFPLNDFSVYLDGVKATLLGLNPYKMWFFDRYNYAPIASILLWPFSLIPVNLAEYIFTSISIFSLYFATRLLLRINKVTLHWSSKVFLFALTLKLFPVKLTLALGQINLIILLLIVSSYYYFTKKKPLFSAFTLSLATVLKLTPAFLVLFYIIKKQTKLIKYFLIFTILFTFLGILVFGLDLTLYYYFKHLPSLLGETSKQTIPTTYMNQSLTALLARFKIYGSTNSLIRNIITFSGFGFLAINFHKFKTREFLWFSLLIIIATLIYPIFVWQHHFVFVIPAWFILLSEAIRKPISLYALFASFITYLFINFYIQNPAVPPTLNPFLATHFLLAAILVGFSVNRFKQV